MGRALFLLSCAALGGCATSGSLARQGDFAAACVEARDESDDDERQLRELMVARVDPRVTLELLDEPATSELRTLAGDRRRDVVATLRFARVGVSTQPDLGFDTDVRLRAIRERDLRYAVDDLDEWGAAAFVYRRPEGTTSDLALLVEAGAKAVLTLGQASVCAAAQADSPGCLGYVPFRSPDEQQRRLLAEVDADPEARARKSAVLGVAAEGGARLVALAPASSPNAAPAGTVVLDFTLQAAFGHGDGDAGSGCRFEETIRVELPAGDLDEAVAQHFATGPRRLIDLGPSLE